MEMVNLKPLKIMIVDDEPDIVNLLETVLLKEGFLHIYHAYSGISAIERCREVKPDAIILDVMLPDMDGFTLCKQIRQFSLCPIFFLSARDDDKIVGLALGGDDYITKPFSPKEVAYRIKAHLRRSLVYSRQSEREPCVFGNVQIDEQRGEVRKDGALVPLTAKEFQLLVYLAKHPSRIFNKSELYEAVWGESLLSGYDNTVMVHIHHLREKLEHDPANPRLILTVRGLGYKLLPQDESR